MKISISAWVTGAVSLACLSRDGHDTPYDPAHVKWRKSTASR